MPNNFSSIASHMDAVETPDSLRRLIDMHRFPDETNYSFREIVNRHNSPLKKEQKFLFLNTYLMDVAVFKRAQKPAVEDRSKAIGRFIREHFDVAALCEVFEENINDIILEQWNSERQPYYVGNIAGVTWRSSGLVTYSQKMKISKRGFHEFEAEEGHDAKADKGILMAEVDVGLGRSKLEIYSTHLNAEGNEARRKQLGELTAFIRRTHNSSNPAILVGDFNVHTKNRGTFNSPLSGNKVTEYEYLYELMEDIGFYDLWIDRNGSLGYTNNMDQIYVARRICTMDSNSIYCNDNILNPAIDADRIDYIFVSKPNVENSFNLDFTRPRRTTQMRPSNAPERDKIAYLSDHLGLATTLILSPKD